jgi:lipopolysaccharide/colanic/teichoic acid biosynthesis glycosyltransferase
MSGDRHRTYQGTMYRGGESMYPVIKRCIDIVGAGLGLIVLSPVLAVAIRMQMGLLLPYYRNNCAVI